MDIVSEYQKTNQSFSGCDMVCSVDLELLDGTKLVRVIGSLQTLTYSIHQEKRPVRVIGNMNAKDYVFGPRTIAGTLIFAVFNKHWAHDIMGKFQETPAHFLMDELPPFNITISAANEYGCSARLALYGVRIVNEGQVIATNDVYTENTYQFVALDLDYLSDMSGHKSTDGAKSDIQQLRTKIPPAPLPVKPSEARQKREEEPPETENLPAEQDPPKPLSDQGISYNGKTEEQVIGELERARDEALDMLSSTDASATPMDTVAKARKKRSLLALYDQKIRDAKAFFQSSMHKLQERDSIREAKKAVV